MENVNLSSEELVTIRSGIFEILDQSSGRSTTRDEFIAFFVGIGKLHNSGAQEYKISEENMNEEEKRVVRKFFQSSGHFVCEISGDLSRLVHQGLSQYRVHVGPVFARIIEKENIRMRNIVEEARRLERALIEISLFLCKDVENHEYFRQIDYNSIEVEYELND